MYVPQHQSACIGLRLARTCRRVCLQRRRGSITSIVHSSVPCGTASSCCGFLSL